jgi:dTDP-4-dehydrorhamnose reductase
VKILVLGAGGMAGHMIALYFTEQGYDVSAYTRKPFPYCNNILGDAMDGQDLKRILISGNYDIVINCIGVLNQDAEARKTEAVFLNAFLPHFLVETLKNTNAKLIHMSTDCVFSGKSGPYRENSLKDGESFYARSKALGEIEDSKNLTFRTSIVGPDFNQNGIGLFNWFMSQKGTTLGYTRAFWTGVTTLTLAKAMEQAIKENLTGLYHLVNKESISKFNLICLFNKCIRNDTLSILPNKDVSVDKSLLNSRTDFSFQVPLYEQMVWKMKEWMDLHRNLYPHYFGTYE